MDLLFRSYELNSVLAKQEQKMSDEVASLSEDQVLNTSPHDLCKYFVEQFTVEPIVIDESDIEIDYSDVQIDVSRRIEYMAFDRNEPVFVTGTKLTFFVPFSGDAMLLKCRPSTFNFNSPSGEVRNNLLVFVYERTTQDVSAIAETFEQDRKNVKKYLGWIARDVGQFNANIEGKVSQYITARREKLLQDRGLVERLGFPLRRRKQVPTTFVTPKVKKRIIPQRPSTSVDPFEPEPALGMDDYDHILSVLSNMVDVMERSPKSFKGMNEEGLRTHFLVHLNGHYEGQATGETFNYEGKTDILIRVDSRVIFIAECKFWTGPSGMKNTIDQLLGYTSWRDTKTAILVFNRDREMSTVLSRIPEVVRKHPSYKADGTYDSETGFRYVFGHCNDTNRELTLTVLVFDVPA